MSGIGLGFQHSTALDVDSNGNIRVRNLIWNTSTLAWENATGTLAGGMSAEISNFPATYPVTDNSGTLTVDAPVGTPVFVRLSDGSAAIATLPVSLASLPALVAGTAAIGKVDHNISGIGDGIKAVTTAGTRETLAGSTACKKVDITALTANTGIVVVGGATVVAAAGTRRGIPLSADSTYSLEIDNLADVYLDVTVNGEGVSYAYYT